MPGTALVTAPEINAAKVNPDEPLYGVKVAFSDTELNGDIIHEDYNRPIALSFFHSRHTGAIQNASLQMDKISTWFATADSCVNMVGEFESGQIDAAVGVTIRMSCAACPGHKEVQLLSGGILVMN